MTGELGLIFNQGENEMIGRKVVGLSLLSALLVCAFAAQSASAMESTTSKRTTAVTCAPEAGQRDFSKAHCDFGDTVAPNTGKFGHVAINGETKEVDATNEKVTGETKESEPAVLKGEVLLVKTEITCKKIQNNLERSFIKNSEPEAGKHTLEGTFVVEYSECTVAKPAKCTVKEPIVAEAKMHAVEGMVGPKPGENNAMGLKFTGHGEKETFATIEYLNKGAEACSLNKKVFPVKGQAIGTSGPTTESTQEDQEAGSTLVFTPKMETLILGEKPAEFTSIVTPRMGRLGNPIAATTTP
jgi:hypothetical protein